jgi:ABC-2 type transport system ATP-binding protein
MSAVIEVSDLKREYISSKGWIRRKKEIIKAVDGITFDVKKGEIFGLLGQNGAGKTTTIKMLITLLAPTAGVCKVLGADTFGGEKFIRRRINFIFGGEMGVYRRLSARDNLKYFSNLYYIDGAVAEKRIAEILELVGLADKADLLVETYSKGMIQRLQIAQGLINDPEIIFMDEPTVGLDPLGARMLREIIKKLKAQGKTVMLTTHYMFEADELCDRIAIINKGRLVALGTPEELKRGVHGLSSLEIALANSTDALLNRIKAIEGVKSVTAAGVEKGTAITVKYLSDVDVSGRTLDILRDEKIYSFSRKELTLEDAYIQLVEKAQ